MEPRNQICTTRLFNFTGTNNEISKNEDVELDELLQRLKCMIKDNSSLNDFVEFFDDAVLLAFIKGKKLDVDKAYDTFVNYIGIRRNKYPHIFKNLLPSTTLSLDKRILRYLKYRDQNNRVVFVNQLWKWNPHDVSVDDTHKMLMLLMDNYLQTSHSRQMDGFVVVYDVKNTTFAQIKATHPGKIYQMIDLLWRNVPVRFSKMHMVNGGFIENAFLKGIQPFLPKKVRERMVIHGSMESLHSNLPREILPESLGGCLPDEEAFYDAMDQEIRNKEDYYRKFSTKL